MMMTIMTVMCVLRVTAGRICYPIRTLTLERSSSGSLGFSIVGGYNWHENSDDASPVTVPVFVKSVLPNGPASRDGRLRYSCLYHTTPI